MMEEEERRSVKKRKTNSNYCFSLEILFEITKYLQEPIDYIHLAQTNKYFYEIMLINDNYLFNLFNEMLFKSNPIEITNKLPNYIYKLKNLYLEVLGNNDYDLLQKFTNLKVLDVYGLQETNLVPLPEILEELRITMVCVFNETSLFKLKQLKTLEISYCNEIKNEWLRDLNNLTELKIIGCKNISGECLQNFTQLKTLKFTSNDIINDSQLCHLDNLTKLNIDDNFDISGDCFKYLKQLSSLNISRCENITDDCLVHLNNLISLNVLYCYKINGSSLQNLKQLQKLTVSITENNYKTFMPNLTNLVNLKYLKIDFDIYQTTDSSFLQNSIKLETLKLKSYYEFKLNETDLINLINLKCLHINMRKNKEKSIDESCFKFLTKLEKLTTTLAFENKYYKYLTNLRKLKLKNVDELHLNNEFTSLQKLYKLSLKKVPTLRISENLTNLSSLQILDISFCNIIGDLHNMPNLKELNLLSKDISDNQLKYLKNLQTLAIEGNENTTLNGECFLNLTKLRNLTINNCVKIEFENLSNLKLYQFTASYTKITDKDFENLNLESIRSLDISDCDNLISGKFLLKMKNLYSLSIDYEYFKKAELEKLKEEIEKGVNLMKAAYSSNEELRHRKY
ncbi:hypothetical protein ABK040_003504 [Willaertia magna]